MLPTRAEITGRRPHWLLELDLGGRRFRLADEQVDVVTAAGVTLRYNRQDGLGDLKVTLRSGPLSVAIEIEGTTPDGEAWAALFARGGAAALTGARASLRRWFEGQVYERSRLIISGDVTQPEYGAADEPFAFSIERIGDEVSGTCPPAEAVIDETTWPVQDPLTLVTAEPDPAVRGKYYPWVFGVPGFGANGITWSGVVISASATPAYIGSWYKWESYILSEWVIAGHPVRATSVNIADVSGGYGRREIPNEPFTVSTMRDLRGREVAVVDVSTATIVRIVPGNEYWVTWTGEGGIDNARRDGPMRGAGEIAEYLLRFVGERIDQGRMAVARGYLDQFKLDFALVEPEKPRAFLDRHLRPWLPLVWRESEDGLWLDVMRYDATIRDAVLHLVEAASLEDGTTDGGDAVVRTTRITHGDVREVENDITIRYAPMQGAEPLKARRLAAPGVVGSPGVADTTTGTEAPTLLLAISQSRYGVRPAIGDCALVCDDGTADLLLRVRAAWKALSRRMLQVDSTAYVFDLVDPGAVITYTEYAVSISREVALVVSITLALDLDSAELELLDRPEAAP